MDRENSLLRRFGVLLRAGVGACLCALILLAPAGAAQAQSERAQQVRTVILNDLAVTKLQDMDFGKIIGTSAGTVVMTSDATPSCTPSAGLIHTGFCNPMVFGGVGDTGRVVRIKKPQNNTVILTGTGTDMTITDFSIDGDPTLVQLTTSAGFSRFRITDPVGIFVVRIGGTLNVGANQTPGVYTGTVEIDVAYN